MYAKYRGTGSAQVVGTRTHTEVARRMKDFVGDLGVPSVVAKNDRMTVFKNDSKVNFLPYIDGISIEQNYSKGTALKTAQKGCVRPDFAIFTGKAHNELTNNIDIYDIKTGAAGLSNAQQRRNRDGVNGVMGYNITSQTAVRPR